MKTTGTLLRVDGSRLEITPKAATFSLEELQALVGGYVELVRLPDHMQAYLIVNEEGLIEGLPENPQATLLAGRRIVGPAVIVPANLID